MKVIMERLVTVITERLARGIRAAHPATMIPITEGILIPIMAHNLAPGLGIVDREKPVANELPAVDDTEHRQCVQTPSSKAGHVC